MDVKSAISAGKTVFDLAKSLQNGLAKQQIKPEEVPARLMELQQHILTLQEQVHDLAEENRSLQIQIETLQQLQNIDATVEFANEVYWRRKADQTLEGPFCPTCWDDAKKLVRLKLDGEGRYGGCPDESPCRKYDCIIHRTMYFLPSAIFAPNRTIR
ncbi:MAG TPA: bZIP transcription factor [Candidatus Acidoferrum sp.]|jgi:hypothetical protein|nr:bZIP transcription factor [Candidatus Acidoferrum sp.]